MKCAAAAIVMLASLSTSAMADTCGDSTRAVGDPRNGLALSAHHDVKGASPRSIVGQLTAIAMSKQYTVGALGMLPNGASEVFLMQTAGVRTPIVTHVVAHPDGRVRFDTQLARGQSIATEAAKAEYCALVDGIKSGKAGEQAAAAGIAGNPANTLTVIAPAKLSEQAKKATALAMSGAQNFSMKDLLLKGRTGEIDRSRVSAAFRPIYTLFVNRRFQLDGKVHVVSPRRDAMSIDFFVAPVKGLLRVQQSQGVSGHFGITCVFPSDQRAFFETLREGSFLRIEGVVDVIDQGSMTLRDCRQAS